MGNDVYYWDDFDICAALDKSSSSDKGFASFNGGNRVKQSEYYGVEDGGGTRAFDSFPSGYGFYGDESMAAAGFGLSKQDLQQQQQEQNFMDYGLLDGVSFNAQSPLIPACFGLSKQDLQQQQQEQNFTDYGLLDGVSFNAQSPLIPACFDEIAELVHRQRRTDDDITVSDAPDDQDRNFSTEEIMRIAGEMFIKSCGQTVDGISMIDHPFNVSFSGLSDRETNDVKLVVLLLAAAEKIGYQQYESASRLLKQCDYMSSKTGNPVQRVVYYFTDALREKIERSSSKGLGWKPLFKIDEAMMTMNSSVLGCYHEFPFAKVTQLAGIQAIVENVAEAKKIHIIDLAIRHGVHWTILMQALASRQHECRVELLKITAVSTGEKALVEGTGERLSSFAQSLGIPFAFKVVMVSDMLDLKEDNFEIDAEESIIAYAAFTFRMMLAMPNRIENIMRVLRVMNPCLMVVTEIEANHNSPVFDNRFIEVLFYFSAYFDCCATCMKHDVRNREILESVFFSEGIRNMVATEGDERKVRHVKFDVWRAFFVRYGMEEAELSMSSMYQVDLVLETFACGTSCTLDMNGKTLLVGWKGTPMLSISVWKFL
ncbi:hypothetical protein HRI_003880100 [Hibiscus trionum]|uniref:DELLA protein RGL1-like n=1 Tax=Hibiscus trionum TaxID=183268 RepID=A0A9W7MHH6_HIBTR|nr:hypothetical protein HRI_003880100 [Hibiscus trionum]